MEIEINKPVIREAVVRALSDSNKENREAEFVISTEAPDTYGTVFKIGGWDLKRYENNPIVFYAHKSYSDNPDMIIGTSTVRVDGNQLIAVVKFESAEDNPVAEKVWRKVQNGTLRMASIGANPKKGHWGDEKLGEDRELIYFDEQELLEWSIVPLGSNPEALKREAQTIEEIRGIIKKEFPAPAEPSEARSDNNKELNAFDAQLIINQNL
ncbi:HK97 family phage prohead protease [Flavobacterium algicola]|uniref:HK97 family phage prohead protease n=1 Tax=Flavobacterium algicola TaxID=556529 RepID=UPI001EFC6CD6|nr:HK97 family phage prohead protease [Flavobacterium algicola]MCG9792490.1 HK97 family phage prohead protease [Flavobacterium algicola]